MLVIFFYGLYHYFLFKCLSLLLLYFLVKNDRVNYVFSFNNYFRICIDLDLISSS